MENLLIAFQTDRVKDLGEKGDSFLSQDNLFIVAEGLGGEFLSEMAKDYACHVTYESFFRHLSDGDPPSAALFFSLTEANEEILKEIAQMTNGRYFRATNNKKLIEIYREIDQLEKSKIDVKEYSKKQEEYFPFALLAGIMILTELLIRNTILRNIP